MFPSSSFSAGKIAVLINILFLGGHSVDFGSRVKLNIVVDFFEMVILVMKLNEMHFLSAS